MIGRGWDLVVTQKYFPPQRHKAKQVQVSMYIPSPHPAWRVSDKSKGSSSEVLYTLTYYRIEDILGRERV